MPRNLGNGQVVILDRDGTIVIDKHYLGDPSDLEFTEGATEGLQHLHRLGCRIVVITNQSGIGRGILTQVQVDCVNDRLRDMIAELDVPIEAIYLCPHTPDAGCPCRKPSSALLLTASRELGFAPASAIVVGDKASDVEFGRRVGAMTMLLTRNHQSTNEDETAPDFIVTGLDEVARITERLLQERHEPQEETP